MKRKIGLTFVKVALVLSTFFQDIDKFLSTVDDIYFQPIEDTLKIQLKHEISSDQNDLPKVVDGYTEFQDDELEALGLEVFGGLFTRYGSQIVNVVIIAFDLDYASFLFNTFNEVLDRAVQGDKFINSEWKGHLESNPISNEEVIEMTETGNKLYTIMPGRLVSFNMI
jgi:hypothetical protein